MSQDIAKQAIIEAEEYLKQNKLEESIVSKINNYKLSLENKDSLITFESPESQTTTRASSCLKQQFVCNLLVQDLTVCRSFLVQGENSSAPAFEVNIPENEATFRVPVTINFPSTRAPGDALTVRGTVDIQGRLKVHQFARFFQNVKINGNLNVDGIIRSGGQRVVTNAANIGAGTGQVFANKSAGVLNLRTLEAGSNVSITTNTDTVTIAATSGSGDVTGPASSTDNAIARFDGATGKIIQNSGVIINDANNVTGVNDLTVNNNAAVGNDLAVGNNAAVGNDLSVANDAAVANNLAVSNDASIGNNLSVANDTTVGNNLTVNGNIAMVNSTATDGNITKAGSRFIHNFNTTTNTFVGINSGNFTMVDANNNTAVGNATLGALTTGDQNTAVGANALGTVNIGGNNTGVGFNSLFLNTNGSANSAFGQSSLLANTSGNSNCAFGSAALASNTTGSNNCAFGQNSLVLNTGESNIAVGSAAGSALTTGNNNIDIGHTGVAAEADTIRIGTDTGAVGRKAFIANIRGVTTVNADAIAVLIDSAGQLGTVSSSLRYKKDVEDMANSSSNLMQLRPVNFKYKEDQANTTQYGLIAEEVHEKMPELVVYNKEGQPETVKYHVLNVLILNELQKMRKEQDASKQQIAILTEQLNVQNQQIQQLLSK